MRRPAAIAVGDIVVIKAPDRDDGTVYVKRIAAIGGDTVVLSAVSDTIEIIRSDGTAKKTPYMLHDFCRRNCYPLLLGENELYVIGDNYTVSADSRSFGTIRKNDVIGKMVSHLPTGSFVRTLDNFISLFLNNID